MIDFSHKTALVIDDFAQMRFTLRHMIESFRVKKVDMASNGRVALEMLAATPYDIVVCDYNLGEGPGGQQVLEEAKHRHLLRYSSVFIIITAEATIDVVMGVIEHKPDDYLMKPFNKDLLRRRLEKLLARKSDFEVVEREVLRGDYDRAIQLCEERILQSPRNLNEFLKLKAQLCLEVGRYEDAEKVYSQVLATRRVPWAMLGLGQVQYYHKDFAGAVGLFRDVIAKNQSYVEAYDWLARVLEEVGQMEKAQEVLAVGAALSPHAILRQKALGTLSFKNGDYDTAEKAFRQTISLGRYSVYRKASHYAELAHAQAYNEAGKEAIATLDNMRREFKRDQDAAFQAAVMESVVLKKMHREADAREAFVQAMATYQEADERFSNDAVLSMGRAFFTFGNEQKGYQLLDQVIRNNHESERVLKDAQDIFDQVGKGREGREIIAKTTGEVVELNRKGVQLVRQGDLNKAIRHFEEAADTMSGNQTLNLNAAQSILMYMKEHEFDEAYLAKVRQYLERARDIDADNVTFKKLWSAYHAVAKAKAKAERA